MCPHICNVPGPLSCQTCCMPRPGGAQADQLIHRKDSACRKVLAKHWICRSDWNEYFRVGCYLIRHEICIPRHELGLANSNVPSCWYSSKLKQVISVKPPACSFLNEINAVLARKLIFLQEPEHLAVGWRVFIAGPTPRNHDQLSTTMMTNLRIQNCDVMVVLHSCNVFPSTWVNHFFSNHPGISLLVEQYFSKYLSISLLVDQSPDWPPSWSSRDPK